MVWDGISYEGRTDLYLLNGGTLMTLQNRDEIPDPVVRTFAGAISDNFNLMQDNARPHTARVYMYYIDHEIINPSHAE